MLFMPDTLLSDMVWTIGFSAIFIIGHLNVGQR